MSMFLIFAVFLETCDASTSALAALKAFASDPYSFGS